MKNKPLIIAISVIIVVIGGFIVAGLSNQASDTTHTGSHNASDLPAQQNETNSQEEVTQDPDAVVIENYAFSPANITVKKGTTVTWTNKDTVEHNVEFDEAPTDGDKAGPMLGKGETYSFTFNAVGTYSYICTPHPYMKGTVTVVE